MDTPFIEENDQTRARREHLEAVRRLVGNAYPSRFRRSNVAGAREGEDTITALAQSETIKKLVGEETFAAFDALASKAKAGERPAPEELEGVNAGLNKIEVRVAGRIATPPRVMGKAAFVHLSDGRERLQIYVRRDDVREMRAGESAGADPARAVDGWELFKLLDHGDFIGVEGFLFVTKTGELSIHVRSFEFLAKALVPMPDKMHGIADPEIGRRMRYADLIASSLKIEREEGELSTREVFELRSKLITQLRAFLDAHGYVEVETPMLSPVASGAAARPFKTHHNALDIDLYLRIAPELYLKRLLVGGFERVYELNRNFRNEGIGYRWNPEFTMLEFYCAYIDADRMMDFCEEMLRATIRTTAGEVKARFIENEIDFGTSFARLTMKQAIVNYWPTEYAVIGGEEFSPGWLAELPRLRALTKFFNHHLAGEFNGNRQRADELWMVFNEAASDAPNPSGESKESEAARLVAVVFEQVAEGQLIQPTFIKDFPKSISPLSKASPANTSIAERFELYIAGMECANGFSELNDPAEQYERFREQVARRERGDEEAMQMDLDYVRALSYGMPPAAGIGIGIDRLVMLLTNRRSIRDVILFPHMRPQQQPRSGEESGGGESAGSDEAGQNV